MVNQHEIPIFIRWSKAATEVYTHINSCHVRKPNLIPDQLEVWSGFWTWMGLVVGLQLSHFLVSSLLSGLLL